MYLTSSSFLPFEIISFFIMLVGLIGFMFIVMVLNNHVALSTITGVIGAAALAAVITFGILDAEASQQQLIDQAKDTYSLQLTQDQAGALLNNEKSVHPEQSVYVRLNPTTEQRVKLVKDGTRTALVRVGQPRQIKSPIADELPRTNG